MHIAPETRTYQLIMTGAKLFFDPTFPENYEKHGQFSVDSDDLPYLKLKEKYRYKMATFLKYHESFVGPLDPQGRMPGVYADPRNALVQFEDGTQHLIELNQFVIEPGLYVRHASSAQKRSEDFRVGDLPHKIEFWPGDTVRLKSADAPLDDRPRLVDEVDFSDSLKKDDSVPRYIVLETDEELKARREKEAHEPSVMRKVVHNIMLGRHMSYSVSGEALELVSRGKVWALYNPPNGIWFKSDKDEMKFWAQRGISYEIFKYGVVENGMLLESSDIDPELIDLVHERYDTRGIDELIEIPRRLHDCFAKYREHVRELNKRFHSRKLEKASNG
jgi:hypothetical protein